MGEPGQSSRAALTSEAELEKLRRRIDEIDGAILEQLNERAQVVLQVGRVKKGSGAPIHSAEREREIVDRLREQNPGPFPSRGLAPVFREIISATRSLEEVLQVAYLGPEGTFSHLAASEQFGRLAELSGLRSIADVFAAVERGKAHLGVVPVENTTDGIVTQTFDLLPDFDGTICGEFQLRISLSLLSNSGRIDVVRMLVL
jgi:chorismate mutase/prephenate dehydratase